MHTTSQSIPWDPPTPGRWPWFGAFAIALLVAGQALGVLASPPDRDMGDLEKIIYVHVPAAWIMSVTFAIVMYYSLKYLWKRDERDDLAAASAAEVGTVLNGLTLILGMIFAKPTWGVWWTWDARLTSTLVLFLIFVGYLSLRGFVDDPERRAQWSAAVGILGAINVGIVYMSVKWWRTLHQLQSSPDTVDSIYVLALRVNAFAFLFLMIYFVRRRYESMCLERAADHVAEAAALGGA
jgi:heme exporter protein C